MKSKTKAPDQKDYEELGKLLEMVVNYGFVNKKKLYVTSFIRGILTGLGGVIGATLAVALLAWLLSLLGHVPFIGDIAESIGQTIKDPAQ